jgi:hypothetical protein
MFDDACLSKLRYYGRSIVVKSLNVICSFGEVRYYLLNVFLLYLEKQAFLVCYVLGTSFRGYRSDLKVSLLA